ncbi:hypothetical protein ACFSC3_18755 [Sphingomonas floccifaciens]|uniref:Uncharacterized protein n=1 Tax=Sphingomonas floccifaciens TaxID=1844115 RepID=A0ABW4NJ55_9SPHN
MNDNAAVTPNDLMGDIRAFECQLMEKAKVAGLRSMLIGDRMSIRLSSSAPSDVATLSVEFRAGLGMDHLLTAMVVGDEIDTPERRADLAENFILNMQRAIARAPNAAASRRAIAAAAADVFAEAAAEGIDLELLRLEPAPIHVFGKPRVEDENAQVFYVHVVMPHLDGTVLTRDSYTIDADDGVEFADYLRSRTLPEVRNILRLQDTPASRDHAHEDAGLYTVAEAIQNDHS